MGFSDIIYRYKKTIQTDGNSERNELTNSIKDNFTNSFDQNPSFKIVQLQNRDTEEYSDFDAHVFSWKTSGRDIVSDDFKRIVLKDYDQSVLMGDVFYFDSLYWLTVEKRAINNVIPSYGIQQCNNTLNFEISATPYSYPCIVLDKSSRYSEGFKFHQYLSLEDNQIMVIVINNDYTNSLDLNKRFIFSGEYAYELTKKNGLTCDGLLYLTMVVDEKSSNDDLDNNLPDDTDYTTPNNKWI
jgi:hypothetical protein